LIDHKRTTVSKDIPMSMPQAAPEDLDAVKAWFRELAEHVQAVDFAAARHLFAEDFVAFGTFTDFMIGREIAEANQWRNVWPTIDGFTWRLDTVKALVSPDRQFAVGLAVWDSTGYQADGKTFDRRGRATVTFTRAKAGDPWVATHTHMSLFRGTPDASHGNKPSKN
jgi:ketosteroid isomerase-like protein